MFSLHLSAEQIEFRDTVGAFARSELRPAALQSDRLQGFAPRLPAAQLAQAAQMGLRALALSEARGGAGADALTACIALGELAAGDGCVAAVLARTSTLAQGLFDCAMSDAQRAQHLPAFMRDDGFHLASVEGGAPTDAEWCYHRPAQPAAPALTARRGDAGWVLDGRVAQVANAPLAKLFVVNLAADGGAVSLLVPRDTAGLSVEDADPRTQSCLGVAGAVAFAGCRVAAGAVLAGRVGDDAPAARLARCAVTLGIAQAAYEGALAHAQLKVQGARRIIEHEGVGILCAEMLMQLEAARSQLWQAAWAVDHPQARADRSLPDLPLAELACASVAEAACAVTERAAEVMGAMGILRDMPYCRYVHETRVFLHEGAGLAAAKLAIAETIDGYARPAAAA